MLQYYARHVNPCFLAQYFLPVLFSRLRSTVPYTLWGCPIEAVPPRGHAMYQESRAGQPIEGIRFVAKTQSSSCVAAVASRAAMVAMLQATTGTVNVSSGHGMEPHLFGSHL
ncbi:hypothetical protein ISCGN_001108 [Ixodes scapularis]